MQYIVGYKLVFMTMIAMTHFEILQSNYQKLCKLTLVQQSFWGTRRKDSYDVGCAICNSFLAFTTSFELLLDSDLVMMIFRLPFGVTSKLLLNTSTLNPDSGVTGTGVLVPSRSTLYLFTTVIFFLGTCFSFFSLHSTFCLYCSKRSFYN